MTMTPTPAGNPISLTPHRKVLWARTPQIHRLQTLRYSHEGVNLATMQAMYVSHSNMEEQGLATPMIPPAASVLL